ncbi:MAG: LysR family transcriptional regulator [Hyphomicrobiaceae bacterium]
MNFSWFRDLAHLAQTGNFSQAAELSNVSQPALSRRIKAIEAWVGAALVDRSRQPVVLTSAGVQMLEAGEQALSRLETERQQIQEAQSLPDRYVVTFGTQHSIGWRFYPAWLRAFEDSFGPIISRLRADDLPNCLLDLQAGEVDFVVAYESRSARIARDLPDVESLIIGRDTLLPVSKAGPSGRPLFDLKSRKSVGVPYLRYGAGAPISQHIDPVIDKHGLKSRLQVVYENSMAGALRIRAREGGGVAWLPASLISPDLESGIVVPVGGTRWQIPLEIRLFRIGKHNNSVTRQIWSFLAQRQDMPLIEEL